MAELFGFEIKRKQEEKELPSFAPKQDDDGALVLAEGGAYGQYVDMEGAIRTESELVSKWLSLLSFGLMNVTGHPKGKRNFSSRLGALPVMSSMLLAELSIWSMLLGRQLAVSIHDSTA